MFKRLCIPVLAGLALLPLHAGAWIGYHGGGFVRGPEGGVAAWHRGGWGGLAAPTLRPRPPLPAPVPVYGGGCWGCAAGAAAAAGAVGLAAGAAIGAAAAGDGPAVVQQPVYVSTPTVGSMVVALPGACTSATVNGVRYYKCDGSFYKPHFGSNGVYYTVVANPF